jgi:hypothetical protein
MLKLSKFELDPGEADPICICCKQAIVNELAEISTMPGHFHQACGLLTEHIEQTAGEYVQDFMSTAQEYARGKNEY